MEIKNKRRSKCYGLLLVLFIIFGFSLSVFSDANAAQNVNSWLSLQVNQRTTSGGDWTIRTITNGSVLTYTGSHISISSINASGAVSNLSGSAWTGDGVFSLKITKGVEGGFVCPAVVGIYIRPEQGTRVSENSQVVSCTRSEDAYYYVWTIHVQSSGTLSQVTNASSFYVSFQSNQANPLIDYTTTPNSSTIVQLTGSINFIMTTDANTSALGDINQSITNQTIIIEEHYQQENQAYENISNQSANDIQGATNQQTTNIIGVVSSFVSALSNINSGSCSLELPFPSFAGGTITANPCNFKDKAPTIVTIGSSLLLICVFVPLAFIVLRMIYNEIRSWTNG